MSKSAALASVRKPAWLQKRIGGGGGGGDGGLAAGAVSQLIQSERLNTVCQSARCPNKGECFGQGVATFMILGRRCSRNCGFCAVETGKPDDQAASSARLIPEPERVAATALKLSLKHVVITSVTRDDLPDGGASVFAATVMAVREKLPDVTIEVLTPDFQNSKKAIDTVLKSRPDVFNHNIETVPTLYKTVRPQAIYEQSLEILSYAKNKTPEIFVKSGLMLGLSETEKEVVAVMTDLSKAGVDILTIGQYLQPTKKNLPVVEYIPPQKFEDYKIIGDALGFIATFAGPYVRSSYHAARIFRRAKTA